MQRSVSERAGGGGWGGTGTQTSGVTTGGTGGSGSRGVAPHLGGPVDPCSMKQSPWGGTAAAVGRRWRRTPVGPPPPAVAMTMTRRRLHGSLLLRAVGWRGWGVPPGGPGERRRSPLGSPLGPGRACRPASPPVRPQTRPCRRRWQRGRRRQPHAAVVVAAAGERRLAWGGPSEPAVGHGGWTSRPELCGEDSLARKEEGKEGT